MRRFCTTSKRRAEKGFICLLWSSLIALETHWTRAFNFTIRVECAFDTTDNEPSEAWLLSTADVNIISFILSRSRLEMLISWKYDEVFQSSASVIFTIHSNLRHTIYACTIPRVSTCADCATCCKCIACPHQGKGTPMLARTLTPDTFCYWREYQAIACTIALAC